MRRQLDQRFAGLSFRIPARPYAGWVKTIRRALGMTTVALAERMSISDSRASRLERAELDDSLRLSTLRRAAEALNCSLVYVFVPDEPLEDMVLHQAYAKAEQEVLFAFPFASDREEHAVEIEDRVETRTLELIDTQGLWRAAPARGGMTPLRRWEPDEAPE